MINYNNFHLFYCNGTYTCIEENSKTLSEKFGSHAVTVFNLDKDFQKDPKKEQQIATQFANLIYEKKDIAKLYIITHGHGAHITKKALEILESSWQTLEILKPNKMKNLRVYAFDGLVSIPKNLTHKVYNLESRVQVDMDKVKEGKSDFSDCRIFCVYKSFNLGRNEVALNDILKNSNEVINAKYQTPWTEPETLSCYNIKFYDDTFLKCIEKKINKQNKKIKLIEKLNSFKKNASDVVEITLKRSYVKDEQLGEVFKSCTNLDTLGLFSCENLTTKTFAHLPKKILRLNLSNCRISNDDLKHLPVNVHTLRLFGCEWINNEGIKNLPKLVIKLTLGDCDFYRRLTSEMFEYLPKHLTELYISNLKLISNEDVLFLPKTLESLSLPNCEELTDEGLILLSKHLPNLETLNLKGCKKLTDKGLKFLSKSSLTELKNLDIGECKEVTAKGISHLSNCPQLKVLGLSYIKMTPEMCKSLPRGLQELDLRATQIEDEVIEYLPKSLMSLNLSDGYHLTWCSKLTDAAVKDLPPNLEKLVISYCAKITGEGLKNLPTNLKKFKCKRNAPFKSIEKLPETIRHLSLYRCISSKDQSMEWLPKDLKILALDSETKKLVRNVPNKVKIISWGGEL